MGYSRTLNAEARYKQERRAKLAKAAGLNQREREKLARTKRHSAALSVIGGTTGVGALAALGGSRLKLLRPATRARLSAAQTPLLTTGAGTGGINAFLGAKVQNREAKQVEAAKALSQRTRYTLGGIGVSGAALALSSTPPLRDAKRKSRLGRDLALHREYGPTFRAMPRQERKAVVERLHRRRGDILAMGASRQETSKAAESLIRPIPLLPPGRRPAYVDSHLRRRRHASGLVSTSRVRAGVR